MANVSTKHTTPGQVNPINTKHTAPVLKNRADGAVTDSFRG